MNDESPQPVPQCLRTRTFRSLQHKNYRRYFIGQFISFTGSWIQSTAMMWLVFDLTNDPRWPAYLLVAMVGPTMLLGPIGGAIADRFPKRKVIAVTQLAFMFNAALLVTLVAADLCTPVVLLAVQFASGLIQAFDFPARLALVSDLVPKEDVVNAVGLNSLLFNSARAIGPGIAGLVYLGVQLLLNPSENSSATKLGSMVCFGVNTVSFLAVLLALRSLEVGHSVAPKLTAGSFLEGIRYLRKESTLALLLIGTGVYCIFAWPVLTLFPAYTRFVLGRAEESYSLLLSSFGAGALVGALATATYGSTHRRAAFLVLGATCGWIGLGLLTITAYLPFALGSCALLGFGMVLFLSTGQSTIQTCVPNELRGRVLAIWAMMLSVSALPGHLTAGILASHFPLQYVLIGMTLGVAATVFGMLVLIAKRSLPNPAS